MAEEAVSTKRRKRSRSDQRATELGIDLGLLDENLSLTPLERMRQHDESVRQVLAARQGLGILERDDS